MASPIEFDAGAREDFDDALVRPLIEIDVRIELDQHKPDFTDLDHRFGDLCKSTDLDAAMLEYVKANARGFHLK